MYSGINCYNENYNFNEIFKYDNSAMLIRAMFGLNRHQKYYYPKILRHNYKKTYISKLNQKMQRKNREFSVSKPDSV